jgi:hypothetical protein
VELAVESDEPLDALSLTGKVHVTESGRISATIRGAELEAAHVAAPASAAPLPALRRPQRTEPPGEGELRDNLPDLVTAFWLAQQTGELAVNRGKVKKAIYFESINSIAAPGEVRLKSSEIALDGQAMLLELDVGKAAVGRYFAVVDMIFASQGSWAVASDPIADLAKSLRIAGMGDNEVKSCLANDAVANGVIADYRGGETLGVNSTPTLFINGQQYRGTRTADDLDAAFAKLTQ